jgi:hypothetical protein
VLLTSPIPHVPVRIEADGVRGIPTNWRDSPTEQSISIGAETSGRGLGLYLCFLTTSGCSSRCSPSVATRMATPFNTFCSSSRMCSSPATTLCRSWISATTMVTPASLVAGADLPIRHVARAQLLQRRWRASLPSPRLGQRKWATMAARSSGRDRTLDLWEEGCL